VAKKRLRIPANHSKSEPAYWEERLFRNEFNYKGKKRMVRAWSVKIQRFGRRRAFTLTHADREMAAAEACQIYRQINEHGWDAVKEGRWKVGTDSRWRGHHSIGSTTLEARWKPRLIHRTYPEPARPQREPEFSVRIEHGHSRAIFPLGTGKVDEAEARARRIYGTVLNEGWAAANRRFARELSIALRWQDNPLAWTYTTIHTSPRNSPGQAESVGPAGTLSVALIEPDKGIQVALANGINQQAGFRCEMVSEQLVIGELSRMDLVLANHDLPEEPGTPGLQQLPSSLALICYSVFEDADELFKSTPGGSVVYMLNRTSPSRLFEPITEMGRPASRDRIASCVRSYFQRLSGLLPSGTSSWEHARLTPREQQILEFLSKGDLVKEIADRLGISNWTVQGHIKSIFEKLDVHTRTEAVIKYLHK
jgi:DNA-binding NarL/FixJ family response regulator